MTQESTGLAQWVGQEFSLWERVGLTFRALGYMRPIPDVPEQEGGYVGNIAAQYIAHFTQDEVLDIVAFARMHSQEYLHYAASFHDMDIEQVRGSRQEMLRLQEKGSSSEGTPRGGREV